MKNGFWNIYYIPLKHIKTHIFMYVFFIGFLVLLCFYSFFEMLYYLFFVFYFGLFRCFICFFIVCTLFFILGLVSYFTKPLYTSTNILYSRD